ncbi:hypothetical protein AB0J57_33860 [Streptomyces sp. NPDC049837]|uniref:hypothetical protein n=1 Tax=Streptomyces sp. NPDC049837 TaxID=3155277 RepID=UPI00343C6A2B
MSGSRTAEETRDKREGKGSSSAILWDFARLPRLRHRSLNVLGRCSFTASVPSEGLRSVRDPEAVELHDDDDGGED